MRELIGMVGEHTSLSASRDFIAGRLCASLWAKRLMGKTAHGQNAHAHFSAHGHTRNSARLLTDDLEAMLTDLASRVSLIYGLGSHACGFGES